MIPIRDQIPTRRVPFVNYFLILANIVVFVFQFLAGPYEDALVYEFALIPYNFITNLSISNIRGKLEVNINALHDDAVRLHPTINRRVKRIVNSLDCVHG